MALYRTSSHNLFADAFFLLNNRLMFASLYGRDADMLSMLALMNNGDIGSLGFHLPEDSQHYPILTTAQHFYKLHKHMTKIQTHNYGVLVHTFVYSEEVNSFNQDSKTAWLISDNLKTNLKPQIWRTIYELTDVPLLEHWSNRVIEQLKQQDCISLYPPGIRPQEALVGIQACHIRLPEDFDLQVGQWIQEGLLDAA